MVLGGIMAIIGVSDLFNDLPVVINSDDVLKYTGIDLTKSGVLKGDSNVRVSQFLDTVHEHIYNFLIFATGDRRIKTRIINNYIDELQKPIKNALLVQARYLLNNGNIELFNGLIKTVQGVDVKETADIIEKVLAPTIINILAGTKPNILFAGR